ncbi:hypothetical protein EK904_000028 [Melospiza melodia maxima]|nr:hypothetical protein EK904_000028 [Melospiza melodia maxima]
MALYLPPNNQQTFFGVAIVRVVGMAMQMLAWSREGGIERNKRRHQRGFISPGFNYVISQSDLKAWSPRCRTAGSRGDGGERLSLSAEAFRVCETCTLWVNHNVKLYLEKPNLKVVIQKIRTTPQTSEKFQF